MTVSSRNRASAARSGWVAGGAFLAAILMIVLGAWQFLAGLAAIDKDQVFVVAQGYLYDFDLTAWGWIHLIVGIIVVIAGFFVFSGALWARVIGIIMAVLSATVNFLFLPYYPIWSLVMIAVAVFIIWALANWRPIDAAELP